MIYTVCLDPSVDRTYERSAFERNEGTFIDEAGGKGFNVARALKSLGVDCVALGCLHENNADIFIRSFAEFNLKTDLLILPGDNRVNLKIVDSSSGEVDERNTKGTVPADTISRLSNKLREHIVPGDLIVFSGGLPHGLGDDTYKILIELSSSLGAVCALDSSGEALRLGIEAHPFIAKPNETEIRSIFPHENDNFSSIKKLSEIIPYAILSLGAKGAYFAERKKVYFAPAPDVEVRGTVGAGDNMLAAMIYCYVNHIFGEEMFAYSMSAAADAISKPGTAFAELSSVKKLCKLIEIKKI